jgi:hypothetical protein
MKKLVLITLALSVTALSFAQKKPKIKGDKDVVTTINTLSSGFNMVHIDDALEVSMTQSTKNAYTLTTDKNLQDIVQFTVKDSVLKIYTSNKITSNKKLKIQLDFINIEHITLKNDAEIEVKGKMVAKVLHLSAFNGSKFDMDVNVKELQVNLQNNAGGKLKARSTNATINMDGRTDLKANIVTETTTVNMAKTAELTLEGDSNSVAFDLKDSAALDAKKMKVSSVNLYTSNNADVYVYASKNLELYAEGKSNIYVYGDPKIEIKGLADKSKIIKK